MYLLVSMVIITCKYKCTCLNTIQQNTNEIIQVKLHINILRFIYEKVYNVILCHL